MSFWNTFCGWFNWSDAADLEQGSLCTTEDAGCAINPATGLPMVGGCGGVDVSGNPFGVDLGSTYCDTPSAVDSDSTWPGMSESDNTFTPWGDY